MAQIIPPKMNVFNYGQAVEQGNRNALAQQQIAQMPEKLQMDRERFGMQKQGFETNQRTAQLQQARLGLQNMFDKGRVVSDQPSFDLWAQESEASGTVQPGQLTGKQYTPELMNQVLGMTQKQIETFGPMQDIPGMDGYKGQRSQKTGKYANIQAPKDSGEAGKEAFAQESKLREKFEAQTKDYVKVRDAFGRIKASAKDPSAAGDLALIFNYMKVLDPGSTVREGEFATAQNAAGAGQRAINAYNRVVSGERLAPQQREDFVNRADRLYKAQEQGLRQLEKQYTSLSKRYGLNPDNIIVDYRVDYNQAPPSLSDEDQAAINWAKQNPSDPRSQQILQLHGVR